MKQRFNILKRTVSSRQVSAIERLLGSHEQELDGGSANSTQPAAATPPGLHIDVSSVAPTPALTTEHNSPESASPPSTNLGDDTIGESGKAGAIVPVGGQPQVVEADETEK
jgi:mRNA-binding protein PUF3